MKSGSWIAIGVRSEFDVALDRDMARTVRGKLGKEPAVADDASRRQEAKRQEIAHAAHLPVGWAEFYGVHSFHGPPLPQSEGRKNRVKTRSDGEPLQRSRTLPNTNSR